MKNFLKCCYVATLLFLVQNSFAITWVTIINRGNCTSGTFYLRLCDASGNVINSQDVSSISASNSRAFTSAVAYQGDTSLGDAYYIRMQEPSGSFITSVSTPAGAVFNVNTPGTCDGVVSTNAPPCNHTFLVKNNTTDFQTYYIGRSVDSVTNASWLLAPGQTKLIGVEGPCEDEYHVYANLTGSDNPADWDTGITPEVTPVSDSPTNTYPSLITKLAPTTYNANMTNQVITFTGTNDSRDGFSALYDAVTKAAAENNTGLKSIKDALSALGTIGGSGTNSDAAAIEAFHRDNTNLLSQINAKLGGTNFNPAASGTNGTSAMDSATAIMGATDTEAQGHLTALGSAPEVLGGGSPTELSFEFYGQTLNLDPEVRFPGAAAFFKSGIMLLVALWLGRYLVDLYMKTAEIYATSETGGVPAIGPWGAAGLPVAVAVATAVVGLWVLVFAALFSNGFEYLSTVNGTVSGFATSNSTALYLINLFFPVAFMLSAAWTRIIAPFAVTKVIIMTASAQRFLLGK